MVTVVSAETELDALLAAQAVKLICWLHSEAVLLSLVSFTTHNHTLARPFLASSTLSTHRRVFEVLKSVAALRCWTRGG